MMVRLHFLPQPHAQTVVTDTNGRPPVSPARDTSGDTESRE